MTSRVEGRVSLRFLDDADAIEAAHYLYEQLAGKGIEVVALDLVQVTEGE